MRCRGIALAAEADREPEVDAPEVDAEERSEADGGATTRTVGAGDTGVGECGTVGACAVRLGGISRRDRGGGVADGGCAASRLCAGIAGVGADGSLVSVAVIGTGGPVIGEGTGFCSG